MKKKLKLAWEARSSKYESDPRGVLPKSFPEASIKYLDEWMFGQIAQEIDKDKELKVLDLGCGYGRLARHIEEDFPKTKVDGVDISEHYVELYNKNIKNGKAVTGDIVKLPFKNSTYDLVIVVTTLMYLTKPEEQEKAIKEIFRVLKKGGKLVLIERNFWGHQFVMLGGLVGKVRGQKNKEIGAVSFKKKELVNLINNYGAVVNLGGNSFFCMTIHLQYLLSYFNNTLLLVLLRVVKLLDGLAFMQLTVPLYISYTAVKK